MEHFSRPFVAILRLGFHLLYHQMAWSYDLVAAVVSAGQWQRWVQSVLPDLPGPRVLELGHGPGHLQAALAGRGIWAAGVDESAQMGRQAGRRGRRKGFTPRLARSQVQHLPFPAGSFDQVVATFPTDYIADPMTLSEVRRVLRGSGRLVVLLGALNTGRSAPERVGALLFRSILHVSVKTIPADYGEKVLTPFRQAGFKTRLREAELKGSRLFMVMADKVESSPGG